MKGLSDIQTVGSLGCGGSVPALIASSPRSPASQSHFYHAKQPDSIAQIDQLMQFGQLAASFLSFGSGFTTMNTMNITTFAPTLLSFGARAHPTMRSADVLPSFSRRFALEVATLT